MTGAGESHRLREALGLIPPLPEPELEERPSCPLPQVDDDDRCPMFLMLDRAADYAPQSRNKGAFMLGIWAKANGYSREEALSAADEYLAMVRGVKRSAFTLEEARSAITSAYTYPAKDPWIRKEEHYDP